LRASKREFWRTVSSRGQALFLAGVFFTFGSFGFIFDSMSLGETSLRQLAFAFLLSGSVGIGYALSAIRKRLLLPFVIAVHLSLMPLAFAPRGLKLPDAAAALQAARQRVTLDAPGAAVAIGVGYALFVVFIAREGIKRVRFQTEVNLAKEIHDVLAPEIFERVGRYEIHGRASPAAEVGGDLIDVVGNDGSAIALVADVSGHGVKAGTLMAMVKSATRMRLRSGGDLAGLFTDLNNVLFPLKNPSMYVTCAAVRLDESGLAQFALAGHLPILHYRRSAGSVERLTMGGPPLAMFEATEFPTGTVRLDVGDILAFLTDGLVEVEDTREQEFGIEPIEALLSVRAEDPLAAVFAGILSAVRAHGPQRDDQTLLLVRAGA